MRLIDSHAHLQADAFTSDAAQVLDAARAAGVERLLAPGWDVPSSRAGVALAGGLAGISTSVGVHPHVADRVDDGSWAELQHLAREPSVVAIGETGLDYDREFAPRDAQLVNLRRHLELAFTLALPLILHCRSKPGERDAQDALLAELAAAGLGGPAWIDRFSGRPPAVLHSFSGPLDYAERALEMGCAISFSGLVFRRGEEVSASVARLVPRERLLVETDCPYLSPPGAPRRRNEPRWVAVTASWLGEQRADDPDVLGAGLVAAYDRVFGRSRAAITASAPETGPLPPNR